MYTMDFLSEINNLILSYLIKILAFWYTHQNMHVRWGTTTTTPFLVTNGVKQGGILSPMLFNVYMDDFMHETKSVWYWWNYCWSLNESLMLRR